MALPFLKLCSSIYRIWLVSLTSACWILIKSFCICSVCAGELCVTSLHDTQFRRWSSMPVGASDATCPNAGFSLWSPRSSLKSLSRSSPASHHHSHNVKPKEVVQPLCGPCNLLYSRRICGNGCFSGDCAGLCGTCSVFSGWKRDVIEWWGRGEVWWGFCTGAGFLPQLQRGLPSVWSTSQYILCLHHLQFPYQQLWLPLMS